jgi:hypothetical protein
LIILIGHFRKEAVDAERERRLFPRREGIRHTQANRAVVKTRQKTRRKLLCFGVFVAKVLARNTHMV